MNYRYVVKPPTKVFDTRHDAVGFLAVDSRKYNYVRQGAQPSKVEQRIEITPAEPDRDGG